MRFKFYFLCFSAAFVLGNFPTILNAQGPTEQLIYNANINADCNGYWEYLPDGYDPNGSTLYPLFFYIHGVGEVGNGNTELAKLYNIGDGPPYFVHEKGYDLSSFVVNGTPQKVIILAPQFIRPILNWDAYPTVEEIITCLIIFWRDIKLIRVEFISWASVVAPVQLCIMQEKETFMQID